MQRITTSKPINNPIFRAKSTGREDVGSFGFELDSAHDDVVNNQIGINAVGRIKLVVQKDHADLIGCDSPARCKGETVKVCSDVFKSLNGLFVDLQSKRLGSVGSPRVDGDGSRVTTVCRELEEAVSVKRIPAPKPFNDTVFGPKSGGRENVGSFRFELDSAHNDIVNHQIGINSIGRIKLVVQKDHSKLISRDIPGRFKVETAKVRPDVFKSLNGLSVDLQSKRLSSFKTPRVDRDGSRIATATSVLKESIGMEQFPSAKSRLNSI